MKLAKIFVIALVAMLPVSVAVAQGTSVAFGALKQDTTLPVEVTSDSLNISQTDGTAIFIGNVLVGQGEMRMSAAKVRVEYTDPNSAEGRKISRLIASGGVTLVNGPEAAEAKDAVYDVEHGTILMTGDVILTQGANALSSDKMTVDLNTGFATMDGRVRTVFVTEEKKQ